MMDSVSLFERAGVGAAAMAATVTPTQRSLPTPCSEWDVAALVAHMQAGTGYLLGALGLDRGPGAGNDYLAAVDECVRVLRAPGALDRRCMSPAGFEWSVTEAAAGTAMDQLVHTWDLAVAIGGDRNLDPEVVDEVVARFLPHMPDIGREAGIVGPEVLVAPGAPTQDRLLGAMGRRP
jgi:uncharacterized protein (TIGR03086 family)